MRNPTTGPRLAACVCVLLLAAGAAHAKSWRGVVPLRSTRAQVERRLGRPNPRNKHYEFRDERAFIVYASGEPCGANSGVGWDARRDTVVSIVVTPKTRLLFSSLRLDPQKFKRYAGPEIAPRVRYTDEEEGVTYTVREPEGETDGRVLRIDYGPSARDAANRRCP
jgi:hypothetical protein